MSLVEGRAVLGLFGSALKAQFFAAFRRIPFLQSARLAFWLAEVRSRHKTVKQIALQQEPPSTTWPKTHMQGHLIPVPHHDVLDRLDIALSCTKSNKCGAVMVMMMTIILSHLITTWKAGLSPPT
jgi:hypothetical protein